MAEYAFHYDLPSVRDCDSEIAIQKACRDVVAKLFRNTMLFAVPNANKRTRWQAANAKREGMTKGVTDLVVVGHPGLVAFVEIKGNGSLTSHQREFLETCAAMGHHCGCFRSSLMFESKLREWGFN